MRSIIAICLLGVLWITGCDSETTGANDQEADTVSTPKLPPQSKLDEAGTQKLMTVVNSYYELKDALVATSAEKADAGATKLVAATTELETHVQADSINKGNIQPYLDTLKNSANAILAVKDETTEQKRISFEKVSDAMFGLLRIVDIKNAGVYRQYCPMAFNDKGAFWLSNETEIRNPYFGKKMLECGEVTDSLK
jgi:Cu(I)/Ag(I) efflux system membrane fusion protein